MTAPSPLQRYQSDLKTAGFVHDRAQAEAVDQLEKVWQGLVNNPPKKLNGRWPPVQGLYLWGGVGRGKTYLMDCFYETLPFSRKQRTHFHRFMGRVHEARKQYANSRDPLVKIAVDLSHETRVLCFDEFFVSDIADAMILARLLKVLFERGVTLIATSNIPPEQLYRDGLQRNRFLPAIDRIQQHCQVLQVDGGTDYRLRVLEQAEIYHHPSDKQAEDNLSGYFDAMAPDPGEQDVNLNILGRDIRCRRIAIGILWADFSALCGGPRSASDYVEIARGFHTVLLSNLPVMDSDMDSEARRFLHLVDELYDRRVKLIISAACPVDEIYQGERLQFEFQRATSRLLEMQSKDYLSEPHLP